MEPKEQSQKVKMGDRNPLTTCSRSKESEDDHRSKFSNLSNWKEEAWTNQGFNVIRTRDFREIPVR